MTEDKNTLSLNAEETKQVQDLVKNLRKALEASKNEAEKELIRKMISSIDGNIDISMLHSLFNELEEKSNKSSSQLIASINTQFDSYINANKAALVELFNECKSDYINGEAHLFEVIQIAQSLINIDPNNSQAIKFLDKENLHAQFEVLVQKHKKFNEIEDLANLVITAKQINQIDSTNSLAQEWISNEKLKKLFDNLYDKGEIENAFIVLKIAEKTQNIQYTQDWIPLKQLTEDHQESLNNNDGYAQAIAEFIGVAYPEHHRLSSELLDKSIKHDAEIILQSNKPDLALVSDLYRDVLERTSFNDEEAFKAYLECKIAQYLKETYLIKGTFFSWEQDSIENARKIAAAIIEDCSDLPETEKDIKPFIAKLTSVISKYKIDLYNPDKTLDIVYEINNKSQNWKTSKVKSSQKLENLLEVHPRTSFGNYESDKKEKQQTEAIRSYLTKNLSSYIQTHFEIPDGYIFRKNARFFNTTDTNKLNANQLAIAILAERKDLPKNVEEVKEFLSSAIDAVNEQEIDLYNINKTLKLVSKINDDSINWKGKESKISKKVIDELLLEQPPFDKPKLENIHAVRRCQKYGATLLGAVSGIVGGGAYSIVTGGGIGALYSGIAGAGTGYLGFEALIAQDAALAQKSGFGKILTHAGIVAIESAVAVTDTYANLGVMDVIKVGLACSAVGSTDANPAYGILCLLPETINKAVAGYKAKASLIENAPSENASIDAHGPKHVESENKIVENVKNGNKNFGRLFSSQRLIFTCVMILIGTTSGALLSSSVIVPAIMSACTGILGYASFDKVEALYNNINNYFKTNDALALKTNIPAENQEKNIEISKNHAPLVIEAGTKYTDKIQSKNIHDSKGFAHNHSNFKELLDRISKNKNPEIGG